MWWLLMIVVPIGLLMLGVHLLQMKLMWQEVRKMPQQFRQLPRRTRLTTAICLAVSLGWAVVMIRAVEGHGREAVAWVLLGIFGALGLFSLALPPLLWRQERKRRRRQGHSERGAY